MSTAGESRGSTLEPSHRFVVVSGVPGCGKSTVGGSLASQLGWPYLDKDEILESLFDGLGCANEETRHRLSRAADRVLEAVARSCPTAVLDSFWRSPRADGSSGTPSEWLMAPEIHAVEVFCHCPSELAATRFLGRVRHAGHLDSGASRDALVAQSRRLADTYPLGVGTSIEVSTADPVDMDGLARRVRTVLER